MTDRENIYYPHCNDCPKNGNCHCFISDCPGYIWRGVYINTNQISKNTLLMENRNIAKE